MCFVVLLAGFFPFSLLILVCLFLLPPPLCPACPAWIPLCHVTFGFPCVTSYLQSIICRQPVITNLGLYPFWSVWVRSAALPAAASLLRLHPPLRSGNDAVLLILSSPVSCWASRRIDAERRSLFLSFLVASAHADGVCICCCRYTNKGRAFNPSAPTLGDSLNTAFISAVYANIQSTQISSAIAFKLTCFSRSQVRYVLGDAGRSLVSGWGHKPPTHVQVCSSTGVLST